MGTNSVVYVGSTGILRLTGLQDAADAYQNDATVTVTAAVDAADDTAVTGLTLPLSFTYVAASDGDYEAVIPHNTSMEAGRAYYFTVRAVSSAGHYATWQELVKCRVRKG